MHSATSSSCGGGRVRPALCALLSLGLLSPALAAASPPPAGKRLIAVLEGEPAWKTHRDAGGRAAGTAAESRLQARLQQIELEQSELIAQAQAEGLAAVAQLQYVGNVVVFEGSPKALARLSGLPGVSALVEDGEYFQDDSTATALVRAPVSWSGGALAGLPWTGEGVTITVIDGGIDYTHRHFGGDGNPGDNDRTLLGDVDWPPAAPPSQPGDQRVIGGWDFVGDAFGIGATPQPDPDPAGCPRGHGTHVAGIAAGYGVTADGQTFTGSLAAGDGLFPALPMPSLEQFLIGPGAAPRAALVSLAVFGCSGGTTTSILLQAMELAATGSWLGRRSDVVLLALGAPFGGSSSDAPLVAAVEALTATGIVVVASGGNGGNLQFATSAPGSAPSALSVVAVNDTAAVREGALEFTPQGQAAQARTAVPGAGFPEGLQAPVAPLVRPPGLDVVACEPLADPAAYAGRWVLVDRGLCTFAEKINYVAATGAAGVVVTNVAASANPEDPPIMTAGAQPFPAVATANSTGQALLQALAQGAVEVRFDRERLLGVADTERVLLTTAARGAGVRGNGERILKPDLAAVGGSVVSARAGSASGAMSLSGSSMAAAQAAGLAALLIEARGRPDDAAGVARLKQRLLGTAVRDLQNSAGQPSPALPPQRAGVGLADVRAALRTPLRVHATDEPMGVALSFGQLRQRVGQPLLVKRSLTVHNEGASSQTLDVAWRPRSTWPGASLTVNPAEVQVPAGGSVQVLVSLSVQAEAPGLNVSGDPFYSIAGNAFLHELSGVIEFLPRVAGLDPARVAVWAAAAPSGDTFNLASIRLPAREQSVPVPVQGPGFSLGSDASSHQAMVSVLEHFASDPVDLPEAARYADLAEVGGMLWQDIQGNRWMDLGVAMHGRWSTPRDLMVQVEVDIDGDGNFDYLYDNASGSQVQDRHNVFFIDLASGQVFIGGAINGVAQSSRHTQLLGNRAMVLPLALPNYQGGPLQLRVRTFRRDLGFDPLLFQDQIELNLQPHLHLGGEPSLRLAHPAQPTLLSQRARGVPGALMLIHHHQHDPALQVQLTPIEALALSSPTDARRLYRGEGFPPLQWRGVAGATGYTVRIEGLTAQGLPTGFEISVNGTPAADGDLITCEFQQLCSLAFDLSVLSLGAYRWEVSGSTPEGALQSVNGAFGFVVEPAREPEIFANGFE